MQPSPPPTPTFSPELSPESGNSEGNQTEAEINNTEQEPIAIPHENAGGAEPENGSGGAAAKGDPGDKTVTISESSDIAGESNLFDDGTGTLGTIVDEYAALLSRGLGSLFECEKGYVYFEHTADYQTVNRSSPEHALITGAGGYNVAEKLGGDSLTVDSDWILRKNPTFIVKSVGPDVLGAGITGAESAQSVTAQLLAREGLEGVSSVINRNVLLLSEELLSSDDGRLLAKIYIANAMYPSLFSGVDVSAYCEQIKDSGGRDFTNGIYTFAA